ncbi:capsid protein [Galinsoga mosaic virus]|uniref:Capsid protein n=1 Tax=Galinsoga mosaic virus TaxID=60714 RepID=O12304_GAMV|nr:capsid protein [Galinsoga mosaic virus]CAA73861.1 capsid protein [Galinsoga mosaic virus]
MKTTQPKTKPSGSPLADNNKSYRSNRTNKQKTQDQSAPVAISRQVRGSVPKLAGNRPFTFGHRELIATISNTVLFQVNGGVGGNLYRLNPANSSLFTWLPSISANFDQYRFLKVWLEYAPFCSTTEAGRVGLYFDKDSQDPEPTDRVELANFGHLSETVAWSPIELHLPTDNVVRYMSDSSVSDPKLIDLGQIGFATYGGGSTNAIGDLFIHYTIELQQPQPTYFAVQTLQSGNGSSSAGPTVAAVTASTGTSTTLTFRSPGTYLVNLFQRSLTFTSIVATGGTVINSQATLQSGATAYCSQHNVTVSTPGGALVATGTGFGNYNFQVTRARVQNRCDLL